MTTNETKDPLLERLLEPVDQGGYDGYEQDGLHVAAANEIRTLRELKAAWEKRAHQAESELAAERTAKHTAVADAHMAGLISGAANFERLQTQARDIEEQLREAGVPAMPLPEAVGWLRKQMEEQRALLASCCAVAERNGEDVAWGRLAASIKELCVSPITARTYRRLEGDDEPESESTVRLRAALAEKDAEIARLKAALQLLGGRDA